MIKIVSTLFLICAVTGGWFLFSEIYRAPAREADSVVFTIEQGESVSALAKRLENDQIIRHSWLFTRFIALKEMDKKIQAGTYEVKTPITLARVVSALDRPSFEEREITILPGWGLREIAEYFEKEGVATTEEFYQLVGKPAFNYKILDRRGETVNSDLKVLEDKPKYANLEGYLAPDTYRIYKDAKLEEIILKLVDHRNSQITEEMYAQIKNSGFSFYEILTMASILEREVRSEKDKAKVSDLFWRRYDAGWAFQADSTVHYTIGKSGDVFTTSVDRATNSAWNTYKYPGLPLGPISNPGIESIIAAIYPEKNEEWYFMTTFEGEVKYGKTLAEHNANVNRYLR
ncbi:MAG: endolytic transglycosylase MltG [Candidatus Magasanikbacteria bacterium]|nr:endolytic transglycosylase MltG [Candidatus Magasanikbacteria bacterium]